MSKKFFLIFYRLMMCFKNLHRNSVSIKTVLNYRYFGTQCSVHFLTWATTFFTRRGSRVWRLRKVIFSERSFGQSVLTTLYCQKSKKEFSMSTKVNISRSQPATRETCSCSLCLQRVRVTDTIFTAHKRARICYVHLHVSVTFFSCAIRHDSGVSDSMSQ